MSRHLVMLLLCCVATVSGMLPDGPSSRLPGPSPSLPSLHRSRAPPLLEPFGLDRTLRGSNSAQVQLVSTSVALADAIRDATVGHVLLTAGEYALGAQLEVTRTLVIEAADHGTVVLDARAPGWIVNVQTWSTADTVHLIGLNFTHGRSAPSGSAVA